MVALNFSPQQTKPSAPLSAVPTDWYNVIMIDSIEKPTKGGNGSFVECKLQIQGGEFAQQNVFMRLNLNNPSAVAVEISQGQLTSICYVTNQLAATDTAQLHGIPFQAYVVKEERNDKPGSYSNNVNNFRDMNGNEAMDIATGKTTGGGQPPVNNTPPQTQTPPANTPPATTATTPETQPWQGQTPPAETAPAANTTPADGGTSAAPPWAQQ